MTDNNVITSLKITPRLPFTVPIIMFQKKMYLYAQNYRDMVKEKENTEVSKNIGLSVFMNIKTDFGFKKVFGNKILLIAFLNAILNKDIVSIEYLPVEQLGYIKENRKAVYDVYCTTATGERFIVEMQASPQEHFADRIVFYMSYPVVSQAPQGKITMINSEGKEVRVPWDYSLNGVYMICILDSIMFPEEEAKDIVIEHMKIVRQEANKIFTNKWEAVTIELPKFKKMEDELETIVDKWLYSLKYMEKLPKRPEKLNEHIFDELYEIAKIVNLTKKEMETYSKSILEYDDVISSLNYREKIGEERGRIEGRIEGRNEGRIEGRNEGKNEERINIVHNLYKNGMSIKQIAKFTGIEKQTLSDILSKL